MQREFCLGSEWLYYKIYSGVKTADYILLEKLKPIISKLESKKIIIQWFFIRYKDTDEHLRLRILMGNTKHLNEIIQKFNIVFDELLEQNLVWKIQTDTYKKEIERYGKNTILDSEYLFWKDSKMIFKYLKIKSSFKEQEFPLLFSFLAIDTFLNTFQLINDDKVSLLNSLHSSFKTEFENYIELKKDLSKSYRILYPQIKELLSNDSLESFCAIHSIVNKKSKSIAKRAIKIKNKIEVPLESFLSSHIHMMINRQYTSKQRNYELIIYDHLLKYYKSLNYIP